MVATNINTLEATDKHGNKYTVYVDEDIYLKIRGENIRVDSWGYPVFKSNYTEWTIARYVMGSAKGLVIDHINGNRFDNRRENLRWATKSQNALNGIAHKDNPTGYRGVSRHSNCNKYRARLKIGPDQYVKNGFLTPEEAALQVNEWIVQSGIIAPLNIIRQ